MTSKRPRRKPRRADRTAAPTTSAAEAAASARREAAEADPAAERPSAAAGAPPAPGLHLVSTPLGHARDVTLRALDVLAGADVIAAEDTRTARRLMELHGVPLRGRRLVAYHDRNGPQARPGLLRALSEGASVALVSEAGTPLVSDPGWKLAREALDAGLPVTAAPGVSAAVTALTLSGLPADRFLFLGFLPPRRAAKRAELDAVAGVRATLICYESPRRAAETLADMAATLGVDRPAALARELTKRFEEVRRGTLGELAEAAAAEPPRGEVVLLAGPASPPPADDDAVDALLREALAEDGVRDAAARVAEATGRPRREVYARALALRDAARGPA